MASALHTPVPTGESWLARALGVSVVLHGLVVIGALWQMAPARSGTAQLVDIELAPAPPKAEALPAELARKLEAPPPSSTEPAATTAPEPAEPAAPVDAGIDAPIDAPRKKRHRPDAAIDAPAPDAVPLVAEADAGAAGDAEQVAIADAGPAGDAEQLAVGSGSGSGLTDQPAVEGAPTTAGTAANLLAYFPPGHVLTALVRFDRLRGSEWADQAERLFRPMPDYHALFGGRDAHVPDKLDMLVISTPRPRDAAATTLVAKTAMTRPQVRDYLANPDVAIQWTATRAGMLGRRTGKLFPNDKRVVLSPWKGWFVLAQPDDLGPTPAAPPRVLDELEAQAKQLPPWLAQLRTIVKESGDDKRGPALVVTLTAEVKRYKFPDVGVGITSLPAPERLSLAMELVAQGWLMRGNIVFGSEADATEFVQAVTDAQQKVSDSHLLSALLRRQHVLNTVSGLSLARTGARVSYATSLSIADARAVLAAAAVTLDDYFGHAP